MRHIASAIQVYRNDNQGYPSMEDPPENVYSYFGRQVPEKDFRDNPYGQSPDAGSYQLMSNGKDAVYITVDDIVFVKVVIS